MDPSHIIATSRVKGGLDKKAAPTIIKRALGYLQPSARNSADAICRESSKRKGKGTHRVECLPGVHVRKEGQVCMGNGQSKRKFDS